MMTGFSDILEGLRYTLFPRRCAFCGRVIAPGDIVCGECEEELPRVELPICYCCGCSKRLCVCERTHNRFVTAVAAPFYYRGCIRSSIHRMKFHGETENAQGLGEAMAAFAQNVYAEIAFDFVTFVPMTSSEQKKYKMNQSEQLSRYVAHRLDLPCKAVLCKLYETLRQRTLPQRQRSGNVMGVFDVTVPEDVCGKRILLCDDLRTTGATLNECAKMLCLYGAREVFCLTAAVGFPKIKQEENLYEDP